MPDPGEKLEALCGPRPVGVCWLGLPTAASARIAGSAGFGACVIDCEHGLIGVETMGAMITALKAEGSAAFVRVPENAKGTIQRALDAGADGIVVPYVETVAEAERAARAFHYPPQGARGAATAVIAATRYGADAAAYEDAWNDRGFLALQIESRAGLAAAPAFAAVPGVDMLFFGPFDYAQDAGLDPEGDSATLAAVFAEVVAAARGAGRLSGVFPWPGATPEMLKGADMIARASDIVTLRLGLASALA